MTTRILKVVGPLLAGSLFVLPAPSSAGAPRLAVPRDAAVSLTGAGRVAAAGDVNADGSPDFLVSKGDKVTEPTEGVTYVVFGAPAPGQIRLEDLGSGGFAIHGGSEEDEASYAAAAGDVNGDGLDDVIVGAPGAEVLATGVEPADGNYRANAGRAYVVFGKRTTEPVHLGDFDDGVQGSQGYRIDGAAGHDLAGRAVASLGDVNGDGATMSPLPPRSPGVSTLSSASPRPTRSTCNHSIWALKVRSASGLGLSFPKWTT